MGCGCNKKAKKRAAEQQKSVQYKMNGSKPVKLGLKPSYPLPLRLPEALDGKDVVIVPNRVNTYPTQGAIVIYGRNAKISKKDKKQIERKWPGILQHA